MSAVISPCGNYRYLLTREYDPEGPLMTFIMLNPSTADAENDDSTIRKCRKFSDKQGCGRLAVVNLFAYRATKPEVLKKVSAPIGPDNMAHIIYAASQSDFIVCAWGTLGTFGRQKREGIKGAGKI